MNNLNRKSHHDHNDSGGTTHHNDCSVTPHEGNDAAEHLRHHGVRPTAVRLLVWRYVSRRKQTFTLYDAEEAMPDMDRSSLFRTLRLFVEQKLLHEVDDGSGQCKYCLCRCQEGMHRGHVHFSCTRCGRTYCLQDQIIPLISLPDGFQAEEAEFVIKGICSDCMQMR